MKLYHMSPVNKLKVLKPFSLKDKNRPKGVYLTGYNTIYAWYYTLFRHKKPIYLYEVYLDNTEMVYAQPDGVWLENYVYIQISDVKSILNGPTPEVVVPHHVNCHKIGSI